MLMSACVRIFIFVCTCVSVCLFIIHEHLNLHHVSIIPKLLELHEGATVVHNVQPAWAVPAAGIIMNSHG